MSKSLDLAPAAAFQAYVRDYKDELFTRLFFGFETAKLATVEEGVKGERILTNLTVGSGLARRWTKEFNPKTDAVSFKPRTLKTTLNKADFSFVPTELEATYLGYLRKTGQDPMDFPFEAYVMQRINDALMQEMEVAVWQAVAAGTPADTDLLAATFDGYLKKVVDLITATTVTPVVTGAITSSNAIAKFRLLWAAVDKVYQKQGITFFCSQSTYDNYRINWIDTNRHAQTEAPIAGTDYMGLTFELGGGKTKIVCVPGLGNSGRVIVTPTENLVIGVDGAETLNWQTEQDHRSLDLFCDFRLGVEFRTVDAGVFVVNDQV